MTRIGIRKMRVLPRHVVRPLRGAARVLLIARLRDRERESGLISANTVERPVLQRESRHAFPTRWRGDAPQETGGEAVAIVEAGIRALAAPAVVVLHTTRSER